MDRMKALLVLTVCDIKAVGPDVWNGWKGQLLRTLYYETEPRLTGGFTSIPRKERIAEVRGELEILLEDWPAKERKRCIGLMYDNYLMTVPREDQKRHLEFIRDSDKAGRSVATTIATREFEAVTEITLLAPDHPRLLSTITGCCTAAEANIVDAQVFTTKDGRALDSIFINRAFENEADELRRAERIGETIEDVLSGKLRLKDLFANQPKPSGWKKAFKVEPSVTINNTASDKFTVLEIEGLDRPGVLSKIADAMADLSLDIASAHIATFGEKFIDTFYVTDLVGHKIESAQKLSAIKRKLLNAVTPSADKTEKLAS
jgi:[protein-PII] uridylyltransferase